MTADELQERFLSFHLANPQVYDRLVHHARKLRRAGHRRLSMKMLFELVRYEHMVVRTDDFKLNNDYTAPYARMLMERNEDLVGAFETRASILDRAAA